MYISAVSYTLIGLFERFIFRSIIAALTREHGGREPRHAGRTCDGRSRAIFTRSLVKPDVMPLIMDSLSHTSNAKRNAILHGRPHYLWAEPGSRFTLLFENRLIDILKECDVTGAGRLATVSWDEGWGIMDRAVKRGLERKRDRVPEYVGIDEKSFAKRHRYETLVCDLTTGTVECVLEDRTQESLEGYWGQFSLEELEGIKAVAMDMWEPYIGATRDLVPGADKKIVFDRFHVTRYVNDAVDKIRRHEHKVLKDQGDETLKGTKHLWLMNAEKIPETRKDEFAVIRNLNLKTGRAWAIKESLRQFWDYRYPKNAEKYFRHWYFWATHCRLRPMVDAAKTLNRHLPNILTYFKHRITNATCEGLNSKIQTIKQMACGFRNRTHYRKAILFHCGGLDLYASGTS